MKFHQGVNRLIPAVVILTALAVMLGWATGSRTLIQISPLFAPMQFNTALCFLLLSTGMLSLPSRYQAIQLLAITLCAMFAVLSGLQYLLGLDLGIDNLLFDSYIFTQTSHPGRMAPNTALVFFCSCCAAILLKIMNSAISRTLVLLACSISFILTLSALAGYLTSLESIYGWSNFTRMALHTTIAHLLLVSAIAVESYFRFYSTRGMELALTLSGTIIIGTTLTLALWISALRYESEVISARLKQDTELRATVIQNEIDEDISKLSSTERFFAASSFVSAEEFKVYTLPFFEEHTSILAIDWTPRVSAEGRSTFEKDLGRDGSIKMLSQQGKLTKRTDDEVYYPVAYTQPLEYHNQVIGFDHYSDPLRTRAYDRAAALGQPVATEPFQLFRSGRDTQFPNDVLVVVPVLEPQVSQSEVTNARFSGIKGYIVGVFRLSELIERAISNLTPLGLEMELSARFDDGELRQVYNFSSRLPLASNAENMREIRESVEPVTVHLRFAGRELQAKYWPSAIYIARTVSAFPPVLLFSGFILTLFTVAYIYNISSKKIDLQNALGERSKILEALKEREEIFEQLAQLSPIGIFRTDAEGSHIYVNSAWTEITQADISEAIEESWLNLVHPDDRNSVQQDWKQSISNQVAFDLQFRFQNQDGESRWVSLSASPVFAAENQLVGFVGSVFDFTELHMASEALKEATEAKSQFLANMSHEIRTPITSILGYAQNILEDGLSPSEMQESMRVVARSAEHLRSLVNDILDFSKIEAGKLEIENSSCSLTELLSLLNGMFRSAATDKNIGLKIDLEYPVPKVFYTDELRLRQILVNLIGNAIKFTRTGEVQLKISYDPDARQIYFAVKDTGIGLSEEQQNKLFRAFEQADKGTTKQFGGTGLGLVISKKLAELLGGGISVLSEPGSGSCFTLSIASGEVLQTDLLTQAGQQNITLNASAPKAVDNWSGSALVVEDTKDNQMLMKRLLEKRGVSVELAENGLEALNKIQNASFDIILLDMHMPVMDGFSCAEELRKRGNTTTVIAFTAEGTSEGRQRCLDAGCDDILPKPFNRAEFAEVLAKYLKA